MYIQFFFVAAYSLKCHPLGYIYHCGFCCVDFCFCQLFHNKIKETFSMSSNFQHDMVHFSKIQWMSFSKHWSNSIEFRIIHWRRHHLDFVWEIKLISTILLLIIINKSFTLSSIFHLKSDLNNRNRFGTVSSPHFKWIAIRFDSSFLQNEIE